MNSESSLSVITSGGSSAGVAKKDEGNMRTGGRRIAIRVGVRMLVGGDPVRATWYRTLPTC